MMMKKQSDYRYPVVSHSAKNPKDFHLIEKAKYKLNHLGRNHKLTKLKISFKIIVTHEINLITVCF